MRAEGAFDVPLPRDAVSSFFRDMGRVVGCLPGLHEVKGVEANRATVVLKVGVSFIKGPFTVKVQRVREGDGELVFKGQGSGLSSVVDIEAGIRLEEKGPQQTAVFWYGQASVGGTLASLGTGLLEPIVRQNVQAFVARLQEALQAPTGPQAAA